MPKLRYERDMQKIVSTEFANSNFRHKGVTTEDEEQITLINKLSELAVSWPPRDLRMETRYDQSHQVFNTDDKFVEDIANGMELEITQRDYMRGRIEVTAYLPANLDEIERYNLTIQEHNQEWHKQGSPVDVFDPRHGGVADIADTYLDPVLVDSKHKPIPDSLYEGVSYGPIAKARPKFSRSPVVRIEYRVSMASDEFILGYVATDQRTQVVYLMRQSVQELWGNPFVYGNTGAFLEGIPMLIQGRKIKVAREDNIAPMWMSMYAGIKDINPKLAVATTGVVLYKILGIGLSYVIPLVLFIKVFIFIGHCLLKYDGGDGVDCSLEFVIGLLVISAILYVSIGLGRIANYKAQSLKMSKRLL